MINSQLTVSSRRTKKNVVYKLALITSLMASASLSQAAVVFTFSDNGDGRTRITVSGEDTELWTDAVKGDATFRQELAYIGFKTSPLAPLGNTNETPSPAEFYDLSLSGYDLVDSTIQLTHTGITDQELSNIGLNRTVAATKLSTGNNAGIRFSNLNAVVIGANSTPGVGIQMSGTGLINADYATTFATLAGNNYEGSLGRVEFEMNFAPIPEPSTSFLLLGGSLVLLARRNRN